VNKFIDLTKILKRRNEAPKDFAQLYEKIQEFCFKGFYVQQSRKKREVLFTQLTRFYERRSMVIHRKQLRHQEITDEVVK